MSRDDKFKTFYAMLMEFKVISFFGLHIKILLQFFKAVDYIYSTGEVTYTKAIMRSEMGHIKIIAYLLSGGIIIVLCLLNHRQYLLK